MMPFPPNPHLALAPPTSNIWRSDAAERHYLCFNPCDSDCQKPTPIDLCRNPKLSQRSRTSEEQDVRVMPRVEAVTQLSLKRILISASPGNSYEGSQLSKASLPSSSDIPVISSYIPVTTANGQQGSCPHPPSTATGVEPGWTKSVCK